MKTKIFVAAAVLILCGCGLLSSNASAQGAFAGKIDWVAGFITGTGQGTAQPSGNKALDQIMAIRAATVGAQRSLLETIKGVRIDSETLVENAMLKQDTIMAQVTGIIQGAQVVKTTIEWPDAAPLVTVEMRICLTVEKCKTGRPLLGALNLDERNDPPQAPPERFPLEPAPAPASPPPPVSAPPAAPAIAGPKVYPYDSSKPVTGVVIALEGRNFERALMPVVTTVGENKGPLTVYSAKNVNPKVIRTYGVVRYADSVDQARQNPYIGDNILVIPAENVTRDNLIVIPTNGARKIRETISNGNDYLSDAKVVIADR
jgi:hypothetical protein